MAEELANAPEPTQPLHPNDMMIELKKLGQELDEMDSPQESRPIHNFLQDRLMPMMLLMEQQIGYHQFFLQIHENKIEELEAEEVSQLLAEEAAPLVEYLEKSVDILRKHRFTELAAQGEKLIAWAEEITLEPGDEPDAADQADGADEPDES